MFSDGRLQRTLGSGHVRGRIEMHSRHTRRCVKHNQLLPIYNAFHLLTLKALPHQWVALVLTFSNPCGQECWRPSAHPSSYLFWWCPCVLMLVFLWVSHFLPPCPALFWSLWSSYLRLVCPYQQSRFCIRCIVIDWTVAAFLISLFLMWSLRLTLCIHRNILISVVFIYNATLTKLYM